MIGHLLRSRNVLRALRFGLSALILVSFMLALGTQLASLRDYHWQIKPEYLLAASAVALGRGTVLVYPWWRIVRAWGYPLAWGRALRLYILSGLARYLPGQWWYVPGRIYLAERVGVGKAITAASTVVETVLLTGTALGVALIGMAAVPAWSGYALYLLALGVSIFSALLLSPRLVMWLSNQVLKIAGQERLRLTLSVGDTARIMAGCVLNWLMYGLIAFFLLMGVAEGEHLHQVVAVIGLFTASVLGGSIGLLVPQGIVVREGVLVYLLHSLLGVPVPVSIAVAALTRLTATCAEGVWALISLRL